MGGWAGSSKKREETCGVVLPQWRKRSKLPNQDNTTTTPPPLARWGQHVEQVTGDSHLQNILPPQWHSATGHCPCTQFGFVQLFHLRPRPSPLALLFPRALSPLLDYLEYLKKHGMCAVAHGVRAASLWSLRLLRVQRFSVRVVQEGRRRRLNARNGRRS